MIQLTLCEWESGREERILSCQTAEVKFSLFRVFPTYVLWICVTHTCVSAVIVPWFHYSPSRSHRWRKKFKQTILNCSSSSSYRWLGIGFHLQMAINGTLGNIKCLRNLGKDCTQEISAWYTLLTKANFHTMNFPRLVMIFEPQDRSGILQYCNGFDQKLLVSPQDEFLEIETSWPFQMFWIQGPAVESF